MGVKVLKGGGKLRGKGGEPWRPAGATTGLIFDFKVVVRETKESGADLRSHSQEQSGPTH